jgi:ComF family protein
LRKRPFYEAAAAPYLYEGSLMTAIHHYKYGPKSSLASSLGPLLARFAEGWIKNSDGLLTMPVPLHPKRLRERGFNQSLLLARHVAGRLQSELDFLSLRRVRYTLPQTGLGKDERRKNVRGAFELREPEMVKGKTILLVDDVSTTGNTLNECARVLKKAGCKKVLCLVLARAGSF